MTETEHDHEPRADRRWLGLDQWFGPTLVFCLASVFLVDVPMPLSRSGSLEVTVGDFVGAALWAWVLVLLASRRWRPVGTWKVLLVVVAAFLAWFVLVEVVRLVRGDEVLQPVLVLRTTLLPVAAYLVLGARVERADRALNAVVLFVASLTLWHLGEWHNMRMSDFLGNSIVYVGLVVLALPPSVFVAANVRVRAPVLVRVAAWINMLAALVFPLWAGSRGVSAVAVVGILGCFLVMLRRRRFLGTMLATALVAVLIHAMTWWFNPLGSAYGMYRLVPPPSEVFPSLADEPRAQLDQAQRDTALTEMGKSDVGRAELGQASLDHLRQDPLIGDGVVYFELPDDGVTQQYAAHNAVLEHANAFGGIGLLGYVAIFLAAMWPGLRRLLRRSAEREAALLAVITTVIWLGFSLTQPTSLIMVVMVVYFAVIGGLLAPVAGGTRDESTHDAEHAPAVGA